MKDVFILGVSLCETASVTLLKNGKIISHILRERVSGIKNHYGLDFNTIRICLKEAKCDIQQVDYCAIAVTPYLPALIEGTKQFSLEESDQSRDVLSKKISPIIVERYNYESWQNCANAKKIINKMKDWVDFSSLTKKEWELIEFSAFLERNFPDNYTVTKKKIIEHPLCRPITTILDNYKIPGFLIYHHLAYAGCSYYSSNFQDSLIFTHDASKSNDSGLFFQGIKNLIKPLMFHNLECLSFYKYLAQRCGIKSSDSAASKFMALSSYGKGGRDNVLSIDTAAEWEKAINRCEPQKENTRVSHLREEIAHEAQRQLEVNIISSLREFKELAKHADTSNFCLSGPMALNCHFNSALWQSKIFPNIHISAYCDETGLSVGAAQFLYYNILGNTREMLPKSLTSKSVMLGRTYPKEEILSALKEHSSEIDFQTDRDWSNSAAKDLFKNSIVAIFQGRSEGCPRALGNRSILANPTIQRNIERMNLIKEKKEWMPYASIILQDEINLWFEGGPESSPFLHFIYRVKEDKRHLLPCVSHVDGSTRAQTVSKEDKELYRILKEFYALQKIPIVMKTSFNKPGKPMVEFPTEAIRFFLDTQVDILYIDGYRVQKQK